MITREQYTLLSINERADLVWKDGTFLNEVIEYNKFRVNIYELYGFFVGVFFDVHKHTIERIEVLETEFKDTLLKSIIFN